MCRDQFSGFGFVLVNWIGGGYWKDSSIEDEEVNRSLKSSGKGLSPEKSNLALNTVSHITELSFFEIPSGSLGMFKHLDYYLKNHIPLKSAFGCGHLI